jgi:nucleotide-binding universal stress UspA family protein
MYRSIMIPLDGSAFAEHALAVAMEIGRRDGATLRLVRVLPAPELPSRTQAAPPIDPRLDQEERALARGYLDSVAERVAHTTGLTVTRELVTGPVLRELLAAALSPKVDLIVMSTHARGGLRRMLVGSVADALIRSAPVPVIAVRPVPGAPPLARGSRIRRILVPLGAPDDNAVTLAHARGLAELLDAEVILLRVIPPRLPGEGLGISDPVREGHVARREAEAQTLLASAALQLRQWGIVVQTRVIVHGDPAAAIVSCVAEMGADLIAMATHRLQGIDRLVLGSVADDVLRHTSAGVLMHRVGGPEGVAAS